MQKVAQFLQDEYGSGWDYRVISQLNTCPDDGADQRRLLTLRRVWWTKAPCFSPVPGDVLAIEWEDAASEGHSTAELEVELERMRQTFDKPALILAEWQDVFAELEPEDDESETSGSETHG
jgi:hypothetical protein